MRSHVTPWVRAPAKKLERWPMLAAYTILARARQRHVAEQLDKCTGSDRGAVRGTTVPARNRSLVATRVK
jgi:hypothetical protein